MQTERWTHTERETSQQSHARLRSTLTQVEGAVDRGCGVDEVEVVAVDQGRVVLLVQRDAGLGHVVGGVTNVRSFPARLHHVAATDGIMGPNVVVRTGYEYARKQGPAGSDGVLRLFTYAY